MSLGLNHLLPQREQEGSRQAELGGEREQDKNRVAAYYWEPWQKKTPLFQTFKEIFKKCSLLLDKRGWYRVHKEFEKKTSLKHRRRH